jgi:hypothetical protein
VDVIAQNWATSVRFSRLSFPPNMTAGGACRAKPVSDAAACFSSLWCATTLPGDEGREAVGEPGWTRCGRGVLPQHSGIAAATLASS